MIQEGKLCFIDSDIPNKVVSIEYPGDFGGKIQIIETIDCIYLGEWFPNRDEWDQHRKPLRELAIRLGWEHGTNIDHYSRFTHIYVIPFTELYKLNMGEKPVITKTTPYKLFENITGDRVDRVKKIVKGTINLLDNYKYLTNKNIENYPGYLNKKFNGINRIYYNTDIIINYNGKEHVVIHNPVRTQHPDGIRGYFPESIHKLHIGPHGPFGSATFSDFSPRFFIIYVDMNYSEKKYNLVFYYDKIEELIIKNKGPIDPMTPLEAFERGIYKIIPVYNRNFTFTFDMKLVSNQIK